MGIPMQSVSLVAVTSRGAASVAEPCFLVCTRTVFLVVNTRRNSRCRRASETLWVWLQTAAIK